MSDPVSPAQPFRTGWLILIAVVGALMLLSGMWFYRFDMVVTGEGLVEAERQQVLYAPMTARVAGRPVLPGETVTTGQLLLELEEGGLRRELLDVRESLLQAQGRAALARLEAEALLRHPGGPDVLRAPRALALHAQRTAVLREGYEMLAELAESGSAARMEVLQWQQQFLQSQLDALRDETLVRLDAEGWFALQEAQLRQQAAEAEALTALLEARLAWLEEEAEALKLRAPFDGVLAGHQARDPGMTVAQGAALLTVADPAAGFRVRLQVQDRNVDLIRPGQTVRLQSRVFPATSEGYVHGEVTRVVTETREGAATGFEVWVRLTEWPMPLVVGSQLTGDILLRKQSVFSLLRPQATRENPRDAVREESVHGS